MHTLPHHRISGKGAVRLSQTGELPVGRSGQEYCIVAGKMLQSLLMKTLPPSSYRLSDEARRLLRTSRSQARRKPGCGS